MGGGQDRASAGPRALRPGLRRRRAGRGAPAQRDAGGVQRQAGEAPGGGPGAHAPEVRGQGHGGHRLGAAAQQRRPRPGRRHALPRRSRRRHGQRRRQLPPEQRHRERGPPLLHPLRGGLRDRHRAGRLDRRPEEHRRERRRWRPRGRHRATRHRGGRRAPPRPGLDCRRGRGHSGEGEHWPGGPDGRRGLRPGAGGCANVQQGPPATHGASVGLEVQLVQRQGHAVQLLTRMSLRRLHEVLREAPGFPQRKE
mmetsp:Transcript_79534/g.233831  ORF Transcript_79534/g.233831 Transcript_79534/m.233831 type:complete len:253 (-) Transcript_79534:184-942(-)